MSGWGGGWEPCMRCGALWEIAARQGRAAGSGQPTSASYHMRAPLRACTGWHAPASLPGRSPACASACAALRPSTPTPACCHPTPPVPGTHLVVGTQQLPCLACAGQGGHCPCYQAATAGRCGCAGQARELFVCVCGGGVQRVARRPTVVGCVRLCGRWRWRRWQRSGCARGDPAAEAAVSPAGHTGGASPGPAPLNAHAHPTCPPLPLPSAVPRPPHHTHTP